MIDLNADLGEGGGGDRAMLAIITSASIACGGHAGDEATMRSAVRGALANGVRIGAHPGFADPEHFGRRRLALPVDVICDQVLTQIAALDAIVADEGGVMSYLKLHGALANMAAEDAELSRTIFSAVARAYPALAILALAGSGQETAARSLGLEVIPEAYADRAYDANGLLVSRTLPGSVIEDTEAVAARSLRLAAIGEIVAIDGTVFASEARSICLHGDTSGAVALAKTVRIALESAGHMAPRPGTRSLLR